MADRHLGSILPAAEQVRPGSVYRYEYEYKQESSSFEEQAYHMCFHVHNRKQKNGRINLGYDDNGNQIANSVSPYADQFWKNVEEKVAPLVKALNEKRYLTYSSCQGHTLENRRYVGVAFKDDESRDEFVSAINQLGIFGVKIKNLDTVSNIQTEFKGGGLDKRSSVNQRYLDSHEKKHANTEAVAFNIMFRRKYESYCFSELIIYDVKPVLAWIRYPFLSLKYLWLKLIKWDVTTESVTTHIKSKQFPIYRW